jgi:hypothetical protein
MQPEALPDPTPCSTGSGAAQYYVLACTEGTLTSELIPVHICDVPRNMQFVYPATLRHAN